MDISTQALAALNEAELPFYTVMVPMYREAGVLPLLVQALRNLDYPQSKLEVMLVLEEDDAETIEAAKALRMPACRLLLLACRNAFASEPSAHGFGADAGEHRDELGVRGSLGGQRLA